MAATPRDEASGKSLNGISWEPVACQVDDLVQDMVYLSRITVLTRLLQHANFLEEISQLPASKGTTGGWGP